MINQFIDKNDFLIYYIIKVNFGISLKQISDKLKLGEEYITTKIHEFIENKIPITYDNLTGLFSMYADTEFTFSVSIGDKQFSYNEESIINSLIDEEEKILLTMIR